MTETREWPTDVVLSAVTGILLCEFGKMHEMLEWMAGEPVWTHQLPRVCREAVPVVVAAQPRLQEAIEEADAVTKDNWPEWRKTWLGRYGETLTIPRMTADDHKSIGPFTELNAMIAERERGK